MYIFSVSLIVNVFSPKIAIKIEKLITCQGQWTGVLVRSDSKYQKELEYSLESLLFTMIRNTGPSRID